MGSFVAQVPAATPAQMLALAVGVNAALRGDTANIGRVTCAAGETSVTVTDRRCRAGRLALLIPLDAAAASAAWWLSDMKRDSMTFSFAAAPGECSFGWALIGDGGQQGEEGSS